MYCFFIKYLVICTTVIIKKDISIKYEKFKKLIVVITSLYDKNLNFL